MRTARPFDTKLLDREAMSRALHRQLTGLGGVLLMALSAVAVTALVTWSVNDPSFNHATDAAPVNFLGYGGAVFSDLMMQLIGLASVVFLAPVALWGWYLAARGEIDHEGLRLAGWLAAILGGALTLSIVPLPESWPLPVGLGGVAGDLLAMPLEALLGSGPLASGASAALGLAALGVGLRLSCRAVAPNAEDEAPEEPIAPRIVHRADGTSVRRHEDDEDEEEGFALLTTLSGYAAHTVYSIRSALRRRRERAQRSRPGTIAALARRLREDDGMADDFARIEPGERHAETRREPDLQGARPATNPLYADAACEPEAYRRSDTLEEDAPFEDDAFEEDIGTDWPPLQEAAMPRHIEAPVVPARRVEPMAPRPKPGRRAVAEAQPSLLGHDGYEHPPLHLLAEAPAGQGHTLSDDALEQNARMLEGVLDDFGVRGEIINVRPGPVVTLYELEPAPGVKSSRVIGLADDIARSMSAISARVAVIPGRNAIGIELPNTRRETVYLRELLASGDFEKAKGRLPLCLGKTIGGEPVIADLARMPHLLVAGTTGSGKSVSINTMILSVLYKLTPAECRMILIDPKMLELSIYDGIPHLLTPVVTDPKKAVVALKWAVREMEDRYRKMSKLGVRNIDGFNQRVRQAKAKGEVITRTVQTGFDAGTGEPVFEREELDLEPMPTIVVVVDEMADLMMVAGKDIEGAIQRLAQMARAAGIHLIMATQRPSVDVITGTIKANFPTRISFQVTSKIDSRTILGEQGAEQLLGQGDMLYMAGGGRITRVHGPFVSDEEVEEVVNHLKAQGVPEYLEEVICDGEEVGEDPLAGGFGGGGNEGDDLYDKAIAVVLRDGKASTSYIQRRLSIGYNRAATLIERMEQEGLVGPANHAGKREILMRRDGEGDLG